MNKKFIKPLVLGIIIIILMIFYSQGGKDYLSFEYVQSHLKEIQTYYENHPVILISLFLGIYILITSMAIPGAIVLTVLSGAIFGVALGSFLVTVASCMGASISFLMAKFLFKDFVMRKFNRQYKKINRKIQRQGPSYLFTLRLLPASPFVVINLVMGVTSMNLWTFSWITLLGMLPGTVVYVYAGRKFSELKSLGGILSPQIILSLLALSVLPYIWKMILRHYHQRKVSWN